MALINFRRKPKATQHLTEAIKADLEKVVHELKDGRYADARQRAESILLKDPNIPMAAFLRALILWEGFEDSLTAQSELNRVMNLLSDKNGVLYRMASDLLAEIKQESSKTELFT